MNVKSNRRPAPHEATEEDYRRSAAVHRLSNAIRYAVMLEQQRDEARAELAALRLTVNAQ